jgi:hypothetical protein
MPSIPTVAELRHQLAPGRPQFLELWVESHDGQSMCALLNGDAGWLMYSRAAGDSGFSSRALGYIGPADAVREYYLDNGQRGEYPVAWALPVSEVQRALEHFLTQWEPAPWVVWHDDSAGGATVGQQT